MGSASQIRNIENKTITIREWFVKELSTNYIVCELFFDDFSRFLYF